MIGSFIYSFVYISFTLTIIHNNKYQREITILCKPVANGMIYAYNGCQNAFFERTRQQSTTHVEAANFINEMTNEWTTLLGVNFVQQHKITVMLWEYRWGSYFTRARWQIIVIAIFYVAAFGLSVDRFIVWWFINETY